MIFKYKIHCITEKQDVFWYLQSTDPHPTTCSHNSSHAVDLATVAIIDTGPGATEVVTQYEKNDKDLKLAKSTATVDQSGSAVVELQIPGVFGSGDGRFVSGGYAISEDYNKDDFVTVRIEDKDRLIAMLLAKQINPASAAPVSDQQIQQMGAIPGLGSFPNYPVIKSYTDDDLPAENQGWYFWPLALGNNIGAAGECEVNPIGGYGFLPSGFYIKLVYQRPNGITSGSVRINFDWGKLG